MEILNTTFNDAIFKLLITKESLVHSISSFVDESGGRVVQGLLIQSSSKDLSKLKQRFNQFIVEFGNEINQMKEEITAARKFTLIG